MKKKAVRVSSSPSNSTAPTARGQLTSPQLTTGSPLTFNSEVALVSVRQGSNASSSFHAASNNKGGGAVAPSSSAATHSPFLSPGDGGDGITLLQSPSGPSSAGPAQTLHTAATIIGTATEDDEDRVLANVNSTAQEAAHNSTTDTSASARERALRAKEAEVLRLRRTVQELSAQLNDALHRLDARADASAQLQALQSESAAADDRRDDAVRTVRLEMLESRVKYRTMEGVLAEKYDGDVQAKATELLATHTKEVHDENFELLKEKLLLAQEVTTCRAEYKELQDSYKKLRRETDLDADAKRQLLERSVVQKNQIAALREQVKTCEDNLNTVVGEYDRKLKEQERHHQAVANALTKERDDARRDALRLRRELSQLRSSANNVLSQRSDMDDFFYAALNEVRQRVVEERRQLITDGTTMATAAPLSSLSGPYSPAQTATSLLRLETTDRVLLTGSSPGAVQSPTPPSGRWTLDRKGFPKRGAKAGAGSAATAAANTARHGAGGGGSSFSHAPLPPVGASSRGPRSAPATAAQLNATGTLVSVPNALPAYLRADAEAAYREEKALSGHGSSPPPAFTQDEAEGDTAQSAQHSLPNPATWKEVREVDVASLTWADKERVIQLLFKRMQDERRHRGKAHAKATTAAVAAAAKATDSGTRRNTVTPEDAEMPQFVVDPDSSTFMT